MRTSSQEGLATLSVVNSHGHTQQIITQHPHSMPQQIAATITPVQSQSSSQNQLHQSSGPSPIDKDTLVVYARNEPEPQTLDLSIKKPQRDSRDNRDNFPPPAHSKPLPGSSVTMYRSDPHVGAPQNIPSNSGYMAYHHDPHTKSPSMFVSSGPGPISISQQPPPAQHNIQNMRGHGTLSLSSAHTQPRNSPHSDTHPSQQQSSAPSSKSKTTPKLSPKIQQQPSSNQQGGPKGSITHGTPVNSNNQPILVQGQATLSPRFDGILRQTPPSADKLGSITQGTPVHLPPHHLSDKRVYDYYKNSRQSPAQSSSQQPSPQSFGSPYQVRASGPYPIEQPQPLSSRQIIMNDFITSQQMHGQQVRGRSDKESPSPRSGGVASSPSLYFEKEQQRQRAEYLSRTSPADHVNR